MRERAMSRRNALTSSRRRHTASAWLMFAPALLLSTGVALACTPPRPMDIALQLSATVEGGGPILPGSRGRLLFTAANVTISSGPEGFEVQQEGDGPGAPDGPPIRLVAAPGSDCVVEDRQVDGQGQPRRFQAVVAPRDRDAIWPRTCEVDYEVLPAAVTGQAVRYTLRLQDWCGMDRNLGNNTADLIFGIVPPPAGAARAAPLAAWPLLALILAILAAAGAARRQRASAAGRD
jgi:hypothetical protein